MNESSAAHSENRLCYVRVGSGERRRLADLAGGVFGLEPVAADQEQPLFRSDERHHTLALVAEDAEAVGIEVGDILRAADRLTSAGFAFRTATQAECMQRHVREALFVRDASGNAIDLVARPSHAARHFYPRHDAGVTGLRAVGLRSLDIAGDTRFWEALGAEIADWVGDITYLRLDGRVHHRLALYPSTRSGILYHSYGMTDLNAIMRNHYRFADHQIEIVHGPGCETVSGDVFLRVRAHGGPIIAFVTNDHLEQRGAARQFQATGDALCRWGSRCETVPELNLPASSVMERSCD